MRVALVIAALLVSLHCTSVCAVCIQSKCYLCSFRNWSGILDKSFISGLSAAARATLDSCGIKRMKNDTFINMKHAVHVKITGNYIKSLVSTQFQGLYWTELINLDNNNIGMIHHGAFTGLSNLRVLSLSANLLRTLSADMFTGLVKLNYLDLSDNRIARVKTNDFGALPGISVLRLSKNVIGDVIEDSTWPTLLRSLDLSNNKLLTVPMLRYCNFSLILSRNTMYCGCRMTPGDLDSFSQCRAYIPCVYSLLSYRNITQIQQTHTSYGKQTVKYLTVEIISDDMYHDFLSDIFKTDICQSPEVRIYQEEDRVICNGTGLPLPEVNLTPGPQIITGRDNVTNSVQAYLDIHPGVSVYTCRAVSFVGYDNTSIEVILTSTESSDTHRRTGNMLLSSDKERNFVTTVVPTLSHEWSNQVKAWIGGAVSGLSVLLVAIITYAVCKKCKESCIACLSRRRLLQRPLPMVPLQGVHYAENKRRKATARESTNVYADISELDIYSPEPTSRNEYDNASPSTPDDVNCCSCMKATSTLRYPSQWESHVAQDDHVTRNDHMTRDHPVTPTETQETINPEPCTREGSPQALPVDYLQTLRHEKRINHEHNKMGTKSHPMYPPEYIEPTCPEGMGFHQRHSFDAKSQIVQPPEYIEPIGAEDLLKHEQNSFDIETPPADSTVYLSPSKYEEPICSDTVS